MSKRVDRASSPVSIGKLGKKGALKGKREQDAAGAQGKCQGACKKEKICEKPECPINVKKKIIKEFKKPEKPCGAKNPLAALGCTLFNAFTDKDACKLTKEEEKKWKKLKSAKPGQKEAFRYLDDARCRSKKRTEPKLGGCPKAGGPQQKGTAKKENPTGEGTAPNKVKRDCAGAGCGMEKQADPVTSKKPSDSSEKSKKSKQST